MKILDILRLPLPKERAKSVRDIDYDKLINKGYNTFLFDYDNTIAVWRSTFDMRNESLFNSLLNKGVKVAVVTNAPANRVQHITKIFGHKVKIYHSMKKPGTKEMQRVLKELRSAPEKTVIIGDLFLTDVIAGNRIGMYTILVRPAINKNAALYKKIAAFLTMASYVTFFYTVGWFVRTIDLLTPHVFHKRVEDINFEQLKDAGYELVVFDFDNTLQPWNSNSLSHERELFIKRIQLLGFKVVIVSNGSKRRLKDISQSLSGVKILPEARKPYPGKVRRLLKSLDILPHKTVVVGDQLFTDVLMGNLLGAFTIKVVPLSNKEFFWTRIMRKLEAVVLKIIESSAELKEIDE